MLQAEYLGSQVISGKGDLEYYAPIMERVLEARRRFNGWTDTLPETVRNTILQMSNVNQETYSGRLFGERDAFWLGELVGANEEDQLTAAVASICGYTYFLHQDNIIDGDANVIRRGELALNFLYAKLLENFKAITPPGSTFWVLWNKYLREYSEGILFENTRIRFPRQYSRKDLSLVAARSAPVKICAASLALASGKVPDILRIETAIEELTIGLQIRDDLSDWVEDFLRGNYTPVVSQLIGNGQTCIVAIKRSALYSNVLEELLDESTRYLRMASEMLGLTAEMSLQAYIDYLSNQNRGMIDRIQNVKKTIPMSEGPWDAKAPLSPKEKIWWREIDEIIQIRLEY